MKENDKIGLVQTSLFSDGDTLINFKGKKIAKNMHDIALDLKKSKIIKNNGCIYNLSTDENIIDCQIANMQKKDENKNNKIPPCIEKCCTVNCVYYTIDNK